jgi:ribonuclease-3
LAFLGDSVLGLALTAHLYPRLEAERFGAGRLTKIRAQSVSGVSCRAVAERLGVPDKLRASAPAGIGQSAESLVETERVLASVIEAVIGACYLHTGYERTAAAVVEAFEPEIDNALDNPVDFKSTLQERLARRAETVEYTIASEDGPPHDRTFQVVAKVGGAPVGRGAGRSKKHAEQEAARIALETLHPLEPMQSEPASGN